MVTEVAGWRHEGRAADDWLGEVMRWTWKIKLNTHLETELLGRVRAIAAEAASRFSLAFVDILGPYRKLVPALSVPPEFRPPVGSWLSMNTFSATCVTYCMPAIKMT